jgi:hypothetical protein
MNSSHQMARDLFSPFLEDGTVDQRLLRALGIPAGAYEGRFDSDGFAFCMEATPGRKYVFDVKLAEDGFESRADDESHRGELERDYRPYLREHVDAKWLEPETFFANYEVLGNIAFLGRHADSGLVFVFPKSNERLLAAEETIKHIVSKSLAPRVALFYLEYLVGRILEAVSDDGALTAYFRNFGAKYCGAHALNSSSKAP